MPELPEVETVVRRHAPLVVGKRIRTFESRWPRKVFPSAVAVRRQIVGRSIVALRRRAKFIVFELDANGFLLVHLRMSGRFEWSPSPRDEPSHARAVWTFESGETLYFCDARKFGTITHVATLKDIDAKLGVEPLSPTFNAHARRIAGGRAGQLKPLLLDQTVVSGLGNIYVDEALHRARLHPLTIAAALTPAEVGRLARAIRAVLREGIRRNGTTIDWIYPSGEMQNYLRVYGRGGEPCRRCGGPISATRVGQRGTHFCPVCQPQPRVQPARRSEKISTAR